jgi:F-type H+-transporting ATPase subunit k
MGAAYNIFGKMVPPHYLAVGTIAAVVGGVKLATMGDSDKAAAPAPATPAAAPAAADGELDVEKAINDFLASSDKTEA